MMRVAVDIRDLKLATTGSLTYLEAVVHEFKKGKEGFEFFELLGIPFKKEEEKRK